MNRTVARQVAESVLSLIKQHAPNHPILKEYNFADAGGSIGVGLTMKMGITPKVIEAPKTNFYGKAITDEDVMNGLAPNGTPIVYSGGKKGTILNCRVKKYLFRDEASGKEYIINFRACRLDQSRMPKADAAAAAA